MTVHDVSGSRDSAYCRIRSCISGINFANRLSLGLYP
jgi:hypothetical protein